MDALNDIANGHSSPLLDSPTSSIERIPTRRCDFEGDTDYTNLMQMACDIRSVGEGHNEMLDALSSMADHVIALEHMCQRLQKRVDELEDADNMLAFGDSELAPSPEADVAPSGNEARRQRRRSRQGRSTPATAPAATTPGPSGPPPPPAQAASVAPAALPAKSGPPPVPSATRPVTSGHATCTPGSWVEVV